MPLISGVARSDLSADAQSAPGRLVEPRACPPLPAIVARAVAVDSVRLPEKIGVEAMTGFRDRLYLAWVGHSLKPWVDWKICLAYSPDGREITGQQRLDQRSYGMRASDDHTGPYPGPALAVSGEHLYLAWTGSDGRVNILADPDSPLGPPVRLDEARSKQDPALASHQGGLVLAWTGTDHCVNILVDPDSPHDVPARLVEARSRRGPALCSHQGGLVLAWTGTDHRVNIVADPGPHRTAIRLDEAWSDYKPALCSHHDALVLAWTDGDHHLNILADPLSPHDPPTQLDEVANEPVLCSHQGSLFFTWYGTSVGPNLMPILSGLYLSRLDWA